MSRHYEYSSDHPAFQQNTSALSNRGADFISPAVALLAFSILAYFVWPLLAPDSDTPRHILHGLHIMAARLSFGLVRRPVAMQGFGSDSGATSAMKSVFGSSSETIQRSIGGIRSKFTGGNAEDADAPSGLGNWDNSCYQNSVIQGLASLRSLRSFLRDVADRSKEEASMNEALLAMVERLHEGRGKTLWLPPALKTMSTWQQQDAQEYFSKILDKVDKETLVVAKEEARKRKKELGLDALGRPATEEQRDAQMSKEDTEISESETKQGHILRNPLEGLLAQRVACKACGYSDGLSLIPFNCLTVPLGHNRGYDIRECLDAYTTLEEIEGVQCPKCTLLSLRSRLEQLLASPTDLKALADHIRARLEIVQQALDEEDFTDDTIIKKCMLPKKQWTESTKTKQAVIARAPESLVIHVNRSQFNEDTGAQTKNSAAVEFPIHLGLGHWMLGKSATGLMEKKTEDKKMEEWTMDPTESMLPLTSDSLASDARFELRAVITHFGRHENGHYIAYRRHDSPQLSKGKVEEEEVGNWFRLSDEDVTAVSEDFVLNQGGVFMLFYERVASERVAIEAEELADPAPNTVNLSVAVATGLLTPPPEEILLPDLSEEEMAFLQAEDEYVMASPPQSWPPTEAVAAKTEILPPEPYASMLTGDDNNRHETTPRDQSPSQCPSHDELQVHEDVVAKELTRSTPSPTIRMRTSGVMKMKGREHKSSSESLRLGSRMVSAS